jgi:4'-phosphopantetheinyl transferase
LADDLDFNVTHSGTLIGVAAARGRRVGIDVESISAPRDFELLIQEVMGTGERAALAKLTGGARVQAFYECWTRKEALVKAMGVGIGFPLARIDLPILPEDGRVELQSVDMPVSFWLVRTTCVPDEFVVSIAFGE